MKKDKNGFVLAEAIVVSVFIIGLFAFLAINIFPLVSRYKQASNYNNPNEIYLANVLYDEILKDRGSLNLSTGVYTFSKNDSSITCKSITTSLTEEICLNTFGNDYYKRLNYDFLGIRQILIFRGTVENARLNKLSKYFREYYEYQKPKVQSDKISIFIEFENNKYGYITTDL